jgi:hypothetical protein
MPDQPKAVSVADLKRWSRENAKLALAICEAQAYAEMTTARVAAYVQPIFASFDFICEGTMAERFDASPRDGDTAKWVGRKIKSPSDEEFTMLHGREESEEIQAKLRRYYAALDAEHRRQGYRHLEPGHCPALEAQHLHTQAENALIESAHDLFDIESYQLHGDMRKRYLDILMRSCITTLAEMQEECGQKTKHATTEPSPIDPTRLRCADCCVDVDRKAA